MATITQQGAMGDHFIGRDYSTKTTTIANGDTDSTEVDLEHYGLVGLIVPAMNGTPTLTFSVATASGGTFVALKNQDGSTDEPSISAGGTAFAVSFDDLTPVSPYRFVKIISSVAQTADRTFTFVVKA